MNEGPSSTGNAQVPDIAALISEHDPLNNPESEEFKTASAYVRAMIWMAQADENAMKAGEEPFEYETEEIRVLCGAWLTAWKRAKVSPLFWNLFDRILSGHCKDLLGFRQIFRPTEVTE